MLKIGMGWMGWTEQQTLNTTIPAILLARDGRADMIGMIFGGSPKPKVKPDDSSLFADLKRMAMRQRRKAAKEAKARRGVELDDGRT